MTAVSVPAANAHTAPEVWERNLWLRVRWGALALLGFLAFPVAALPQVGPVAVPFLAVFALAYARVIWRNTPVPHQNRAPCALAVTLLTGAAAIPLLGNDWLSGFGFYAAVLLLISFNRRWQLLIWISIPLALAVIGLAVFSASPSSMLVMIVLLALVIGLIMAVLRQLHTEVALRNARADLARLAVANERMRIARDVHDILGQHLSAVVLKSELAAGNPETARQEMLEVAAIAREALAEVRAAVSGYRRSSLAVEAQSARALLDAADVDVTVHGSLEGLPEEVDQVAAWVVREATTNVIRHARASTCEIKILRPEDDSVILEIRNDGVGASRESSASWGNGLNGLAERVSSIGGVLDTRVESGWFTVRAELPQRVAA
jgi:two-component system, NarL family, sensor histidine kinase DesK